MRKPSYWAAMALLVGATSLGFTSCGDDDDDDSSNGTEQTTGEKPVKDTDFTVKVEGNTVTIESTLSYGNQWVNFDGATYNLQSGKVSIDIPVSGTYKMSLAYFNDNATTTSDEFEVVIDATDMSFLDNGIYKLLSDGQAAYKAATATDNGVYTLSYRLDGFVNGTNDAYYKMFPATGTFCLESAKQCYNGGVVANGSGSWRKMGAVEESSISFDLVNKKVKVEIKNAYKLPTATVPNGVYSEDKLTDGTYYGTFTFKEVEGDEEFLSYIAGWAGTTIDPKGLEITLDGSDEIRLPYTQDAVRIPLIKMETVKTFTIYGCTNEDGEEGFIALAGVSYNTDDEAGETSIKDDFCDIFMGFIANEKEYQFTVPDDFSYDGTVYFDAGIYDNTWASNGSWTYTINDETYSEDNKVALTNGTYILKFGFDQDEEGNDLIVTAANTIYFDIMGAKEENLPNVSVVIKSIKADGVEYVMDETTTVSNAWEADKKYQYRTQLSLGTIVSYTENLEVEIEISGLE